MQTIQIQASDGALIDAYLWRPVGEPRGIVQIAHGMAEHARRYDAVAACLAQRGWLVVANDHRGHGVRAQAAGELGVFPLERGYDQLLDDMASVGDRARALALGKPWFLLGHSMGSFLARVFASRHGRDLAGLILSGTGASQGALAPVAARIAGTEIRRRGWAGPSELMNSMAFGAYNKAFKPSRTPFDWLSRDEEQVDAYVDDPLCGYVCSAGFYQELVALVELANQPSTLRAYPPTLPIYLLSGEADPVGGGKAIPGIAKKLSKLGSRDVEVRLYAQARHEILNETNRTTVFDDIAGWLERHSR